MCLRAFVQLVPCPLHDISQYYNKHNRHNTMLICRITLCVFLQAFSWFPATAVGGKARVARWLVALARSAMVHVRDEHDLGECSQHL